MGISSIRREALRENAVRRNLLRGRAAQRGKPLDEDCKRAYRSKYEYGSHDDRIFCYGLIDLRYDEPADKCRECGAFVDNAKPPEDVEHTRT